MGVYNPKGIMPKSCGECSHPLWTEYICDITGGGCTKDERPPHCPLIEIDLEKDIPTIWYNRQTGRYEPKDTKQEVYERLYKLKNGERRE